MKTSKKENKKHVARRFTVVALSVLLASQAVLFSGCEKQDDSVVPADQQSATFESGNTKIIPVTHAVIYGYRWLKSKIKKNESTSADTGGSNSDAMPGTSYVTNMSMLDVLSNECATSDDNFENAPYDNVVEGYLMKSDRGIIYGIDYIRNSTEANWLFSNDTLSFTDTITIINPIVLNEMGLEDPLYIVGDYPVYDDGQYYFIIIQ